MVESLLLALGGGVAGSLLVVAGIRGLALVLPSQNVPYEVLLRLDGSALLFCLATAVVTTLVFGLLPAWYAGRRDLVQGVKDGGRGSAAGGRHGWIRNALVVGEIALSMVLLPGAGLLMRGFVTLLRVDLGFTPSNLVIAAVNLPHDGTTDREARPAPSASIRICERRRKGFGGCPASWKWARRPRGRSKRGKSTRERARSYHQALGH